MKLTPTSFIVLGLIERAGAATPCELKATVNRSVGNFWSLQHAQLYTETERLTKGEGVLMGYVVDPATETTDLVLLDAATRETVASVHLPVRVPLGFHGNWLPA